MEIHKKINSKKEYIEYFQYLIAKKNSTQIWRDEDLPLLQPFFDASIYKEKNSWSEEVKLSFDHYQKCREEYANELFDIRDSLDQIDECSLADAFGFNIVEIDEDDDGLVPIIEYEYVLDTNHEYPLIITGYIDSGYDRMGKSSVCIIRFVYLKDFD